jgi:Salmonella virulence plasmid 65kDa B protein
VGSVASARNSRPNPVTGTGSMTVPIATSPGRSGFGPQLSLSYDSGAGNGPFGFGWSLSLPSITRKTDKGLPKYAYADESDVFVLSSAEDLVPVLVEVAGNWQPQSLPPRTAGQILRQKELTEELEKPKTYDRGGAATQLNRELQAVTTDMERLTAEWEKLGERQAV